VLAEAGGLEVSTRMRNHTQCKSSPYVCDQSCILAQMARVAVPRGPLAVVVVRLTLISQSSIIAHAVFKF
jgi:hypothetical protein